MGKIYISQSKSLLGGGREALLQKIGWAGYITMHYESVFCKYLTIIILLSYVQLIRLQILGITQKQQNLMLKSTTVIVLIVSNI